MNPIKTFLFLSASMALVACSNDSDSSQQTFPKNYNYKSSYNLKGPVKKLITHRFVDSDVMPEQIIEIEFSKDGYKTQMIRTFFKEPGSKEASSKLEESFEYDKNHRVIGGFSYHSNSDSKEKSSKKYYYDNDQVLYPNKIEYLIDGKIDGNMIFEYDFDKKTVSDTWTSQKQKVTYETFSRYDKNNRLVESKTIFDTGTAEPLGTLYFFTYNDDGLMLSESSQNIPFEPNTGGFGTYEYVEFDDYGNWTKAILKSNSTKNGKPFEHKRTIEYYR